MPAEESKTIPGSNSGTQRVKTVLTLLATAIILWLLMTQLAEFEAIANRLHRARKSLFVVSAVLLVGFIYLAAFRWQYIVRAMGYSLSMKRTMYVVLVSCPLAIATPARMSDFIRAIGIQDIVPVWEGSGSVVVYKFVDVQSLCLLGLAGAIATGLFAYAALILGALLCGGFALSFIHRNRKRVLRWPVLVRFSDRLLRLFSAFESLSKQRSKYVALSAMSLFAWSLAMALLYSIAEAVHANISLADILALWPIAVFVGLLPITVGGVGTRDSAFLGLLALTGNSVDEASTVAATLVYSLAVLVLPAVVGLPFMFHFFKNTPSSLEPNNSNLDEDPEAPQ